MVIKSPFGTIIASEPVRIPAEWEEDEIILEGSLDYYALFHCKLTLKFGDTDLTLDLNNIIPQIMEAYNDTFKN